MLYQIGFSLVTAFRDDAFALLDEASGCLSYSRPEDRLPNITVNRNGTYTVSADIRMESAVARDDLFSSVQQMIPDAVPLTPGYLTKHDCGHDEGLLCSEPVGINWGEE